MEGRRKSMTRKTYARITAPIGGVRQSKTVRQSQISGAAPSLKSEPSSPSSRSRSMSVFKRRSNSILGYRSGTPASVPRSDSSEGAEPMEQQGGYTRSDRYKKILYDIHVAPVLQMKTAANWFEEVKSSGKSVVSCLLDKFTSIGGTAENDYNVTKQACLAFLQDRGIVAAFASTPTSAANGLCPREFRTMLMVVKQLTNISTDQKLNFTQFMSVLDEIARRCEVSKEVIFEKVVGSNLYRSIREKRQEKYESELNQDYSSLEEPLFTPVVYTIDQPVEPLWRREHQKEFNRSQIPADTIKELKLLFDQFSDEKTHHLDESGSHVAVPLLSQLVTVCWFREARMVPSLQYSFDLDCLFQEAIGHDMHIPRFASAINRNGVTFDEFLWMLERVCIRISIEPVKSAVKRMLRIDYLDDLGFLDVAEKDPAMDMKTGGRLIERFNRIAAMRTADKERTIISIFQAEAQEGKRLHLTEDESNRLNALFKTFANHAYRRVPLKSGQQSRLTGMVCVQWFRECSIFDESYKSNVLDKDFKSIIGDFQRKDMYTQGAKDIEFEGFLALIELVAVRKGIQPEIIVNLLFEGPIEPMFRLFQTGPDQKTDRKDRARKNRM